MLNITGIVRIGSLLAIGLAAVACGSAEPTTMASAVEESMDATNSPLACAWAGTWNSTWSLATVRFEGTLVVTERAGALSGSYVIDPSNTGAIEGKVTGSNFSGTWKRTTGRAGGPCENGDLFAKISDDCKSVTGDWYWCNGENHIYAGKLMGSR